MEGRSERCEIKIVLMGNTNVGKTSIVSTAISGIFSDDTPSTLGATYSTKTVQLDGLAVRLQIWDTAGQEKYRAMTPMYFHNAQVALVVYSIVEADTFSAVDGWIKSLKDNADPSVLIYMIGNKTDLDDERAVSPDEATDKANELGAVFVEVSAKTGFGIQDLFALIPRDYIEKVGVPGQNVESVKITPPPGGEQKCC
jgi:small GTP-binding protein